MIRAGRRGAVASQRSGVPTQFKDLQAPSGGLNTRDSLSKMPSLDAVELTNVIPQANYLISRKGYTQHGTGFDSNVETLASYANQTTEKHLAASSSKIYIVPDAAGSATEIGTGYTNARWEVTQHNSTQIWCNGADAPQQYTGGVSLSTISLSGSGLTTTNLAGCRIFKGRAFYWEKQSPDYWYAGTGAFSGTLTKFPLGQIAQLGGNITTIETITHDWGDGPDDHIAFFMSTGEIIVYSGTDPGDAAAWSLVGRYRIGAPLGIRAVGKIGGDIHMITNDDFAPLSYVMTQAKDERRFTKLTGAAVEAASAYGSNFGWQVAFYPRGNLVLYNVPVSTNGTYHQYGINTVTGGAFKFTGMNARCFNVYKKRLYFGGSGTVFLADEGTNDNSANIEVVMRQAFNNLGNNRKKRFAGVRPVYVTEGTVNLSIGLAYDYVQGVIQQAQSSTSSGSPWDTSPWDTSAWSPEDQQRMEIFTATGEGKDVSLTLRASIKGQQIKYYRTDYFYQPSTRF